MTAIVVVTLRLTTPILVECIARDENGHVKSLARKAIACTLILLACLNNSKTNFATFFVTFWDVFDLLISAYYC